MLVLRAIDFWILDGCWEGGRIVCVIRGCWFSLVFFGFGGFGLIAGVDLFILKISPIVLIVSYGSIPRYSGYSEKF